MVTSCRYETDRGGLIPYVARGNIITLMAHGRYGGASSAALSEDSCGQRQRDNTCLAMGIQRGTGREHEALTVDAENQQETLLEDGKPLDFKRVHTISSWLGTETAPLEMGQLVQLVPPQIPATRGESTERVGWAATKAAPSAPQLTHWMGAQNRHQQDEIDHAVRCHRRGEREHETLTEESVVDRMTVNADGKPRESVTDHAIFYASVSSLGTGAGVAHTCDGINGTTSTGVRGCKV